MADAILWLLNALLRVAAVFGVVVAVVLATVMVGYFAFRGDVQRWRARRAADLARRRRVKAFIRDEQRQRARTGV